MSKPDETHDPNQTIRTTTTSGHMTTNSGHTHSRLGNAHAEWLTSLTPEEMRAYNTGRREANNENRRYLIRATNYRNTLIRIARGEIKDPITAARYILNTLGDDE